MIKLSFRGLFGIKHIKWFKNLEQAGTYILKIGYRNYKVEIENV